MPKKCDNCGGRVYLATSKSTIEHPARNERGQFIYEQKWDKESRQMVEKQVMVSWPIRGLGTWHCVNGCKDRAVKVKRFVGAGKETERVGTAAGYRVKEEYLQDISVTRHILVRTA
jgi:hypothetical protein